MESKWTDDLYELRRPDITIDRFSERLEKEIARLKDLMNTFRSPEREFVRDLVRLLELQGRVGPERGRGI
jgi:hypothetical protein